MSPALGGFCYFQFLRNFYVRSSDGSGTINIFVLLDTQIYSRIRRIYGIVVLSDEKTDGERWFGGMSVPHSVLPYRYCTTASAVSIGRKGGTRKKLIDVTSIFKKKACDVFFLTRLPWDILSTIVARERTKERMNVSHIFDCR